MTAEAKTEAAFVAMIQEDCPQYPAANIFGALRIGTKATPYVLVTAKTDRSGISQTGTKIMDVEIEVAWDGDNQAAGDSDAHTAWGEDAFAAVFRTDFRTAINAQGISEFTCYGYAETGGEQVIDGRVWKNRRRLQCVIAEIDGGLD